MISAVGVRSSRSPGRRQWPRFLIMHSPLVSQLSPRRRVVLAVIVLFWSLVLQPFVVALRAQSAVTGTISGTVVNATTQKVLERAVVTVEGTNLVTVTEA